MNVQFPADDVAAGHELRQRGFYFLDRSIPIEIPLKNYRMPVSSGERFRSVVTEDWEPEEIYGIARGKFENDIRFSMDPTDVMIGNELLHSFIQNLKFRGFRATILRRDDETVGFNLWEIREKTGRIMLGAASEHYRGTGAVLSVYSATMKAMETLGAAALRDIISSSNISSLNLHAVLARSAGGIFRFGKSQDCYRKENP